MRGEDNHFLQVDQLAGGSPPHARGRLAEDTWTIRHSGITPACAGKTQHFVDSYKLLPDHPRMRGEDTEHR